MRISKKILAIALSILMAVSMMPFTVFAATVEVNDVASFEAAVATASAGDTIKLTGDIDYNGTYEKGDRHNINLTGLTLDLNGKTISGDNHAVVYVGDNFTIKNGNMVCTNGGSYGVVIYPVVGDWVNDTVDDKSENVVLDNLTVTGGINCFGADVTLRNMDVTGTQYYAVWADVKASITVESGTYSSPATAVAKGGVVGAASTSEGIDIEGGEFTAVTGKNLVLASTPDSKLDISNGTFKNDDDSAYTVPVKYLAEGATQTNGTVTQTYVAKIGATQYETFKAAWNAAQDGDIITLLADCNGDGLIAAQGKFNTNGLTVDFNGHTYDLSGTPVGSTGTETLGFQLLKDNKITFKDGAITTSNHTDFLRVIQNYSDLTLDNMDISMKGAYYDEATVCNANGTMNIVNGSTINAPDYSWIKPSYTDSSAFGGEALTVGTFSTYTAAAVNVADSTINGDLSVDVSNPTTATNKVNLTSGALTGDIKMKDNADSVDVNKDNSFSQEAPADYKWVDNGDGTSSLAPIAYGTAVNCSDAEATITGNATSHTVITLDGATLNFASADYSVGRYYDGYYFTVKFVAPEGTNISENARYTNGSVDSTTGQLKVKNLYTAKDGANFMYSWPYVTVESTKDAIAAGVNKEWNYTFDWDGDGIFEQAIDIVIVPTTVKLVKDGVRQFPEVDDEVSITTADEIDVNVYLDDTGAEETVEYTFNTTPDIQQDTQGTKVVDFDSLPVVDGKRKLTVRVAPAQIRDNIDIVIKDAQGGEVRSYENYSVAEYCDQLAKGNYSENIKTLAKSVLDYGKAAATFFGYNEYAFTNQAVNFNDFTFDTTGWTAVANNITIDEVRYVATSVPSLRFKVVMSEADAERYTVETDKGYKAKFVKVGNDVILQVTGIPASKLGETIKVSVKDAQEDEIATIQYTPIIYAYNASKADNAELARLGKTIGQYSAAAKAVFA